MVNMKSITETVRRTPGCGFRSCSDNDLPFLPESRNSLFLFGKASIQELVEDGGFCFDAFLANTVLDLFDLSSHVLAIALDLAYSN
jgi:hypothetical protein